jgi:hypothetical protein
LCPEQVVLDGDDADLDVLGALRAYYDQHHGLACRLVRPSTSQSLTHDATA